MWATQQAARDDLRLLLADGPTDKFAHRKNIFGQKNGTNTSFKTFERRRLTDFTAPDAPLGVFVAGALATVSEDFAETGDFSLSEAPTNTQDLTASYYYQWFTDTEIDLFLKNAVQWLGLGNDPLAVPDALQPAALHYAGQEAYDRLTLWFAIRISETYKLEDLPSDPADALLTNFREQRAAFHEKSMYLRKQYYERQDQQFAPRFRSIAGRVRDPMPKR